MTIVPVVLLVSLAMSVGISVCCSSACSASSVCMWCFGDCSASGVLGVFVRYSVMTVVPVVLLVSFQYVTVWCVVLGEHSAKLGHDKISAESLSWSH